MSTPSKNRNSRPKRRRLFGAPSARKGGAAVEAAFCFPLIIILMLGTLEVCAGIYLRESLTICAFEGARVGVRRTATAEDVRRRVAEVLLDRNVTIPDGGNAGVTIIPDDFGELRALDPITVQIVAPTAGNSLYIFDTFVNRDITASVTMVREFDD